MRNIIYIHLFLPSWFVALSTYRFQIAGGDSPQPPRQNEAAPADEAAPEEAAPQEEEPVQQEEPQPEEVEVADG